MKIKIRYSYDQTYGEDMAYWAHTTLEDGRRYAGGGKDWEAAKADLVKSIKKGYQVKVREPEDAEIEL